MQIIIPMSGLGTRFLEAGYTDPKPLIPVAGRPIIEYIVRNFSGETNFLFICNQDHLDTTSMRSVLNRIMPSGRIVGITSEKKGPVWAVAKVFDQIKDDEPVIVNYCDFNWTWDYFDFKQTMANGNYAGGILCYIGFHPHLLGPNLYASCKVDENNNLIEIREKYSWTANKMESWQSSGTYYFKSGALLKKYYQQQIDQNVQLNGEFYASLTYNLLVRDHLAVHIYKIDQFCQWGTPEDLQEFVYWLEYFQRLGYVTN